MLFLALLAMAFADDDAPRVEIRTSVGNIVVDLYVTRAPATVANFLRYVDAGLYENGVVHRTVTMANQPQNKVKIEVIQGGPRPDAKKFSPIALERTNQTGLSHVDGEISMARDGPDTATGDFFICIGDQPSLNFGGARNPDGQGFAAFGKVVNGMDVVRKMQQSPANGQTLTPPIRILEITLLTK
jgi:peptidyl-prolyl cis-trans isomerase A (cyclophilin A)